MRGVTVRPGLCDVANTKYKTSIILNKINLVEHI